MSFEIPNGLAVPRFAMLDRSEGATDGTTDGTLLLSMEGEKLGFDVGDKDGPSERATVGSELGVTLGSMDDSMEGT